MIGDAWGAGPFGGAEMKFTVAYNGTDDLFYLRAGGNNIGSQTLSVVQPGVLEVQPHGAIIPPFLGLTHKEAENLANALAQAGIVSTLDNPGAYEVTTTEDARAERTYPESTIRAMKSHIRDLQKLLFGEEK